MTLSVTYIISIIIKTILAIIITYEVIHLINLRKSMNEKTEIESSKERVRRLIKTESGVLNVNYYPNCWNKEYEFTLVLLHKYGWTVLRDNSFPGNFDHSACISILATKNIEEVDV